ncbi:MAG: translesion DNA synthesis-associated protein ImuA [Burkholderiales bacterium]
MSATSPTVNRVNSIVSLFANALVWRGDATFGQREVFATGHARLDALLPGGGWPRGAVTELLHQADGMGEVSLLLPALAALSRQRRIAMVAPPHVPYAPALSQAGIDLANLLVVQAPTEEEAWWSCEQLLRSTQFAAVLFWPDRIDARRLRRLQSAAEFGNCASFVFQALDAATQPSPAPLRLRVTATCDANEVRVTILKRRGSLVAEPLLLRLDGSSDRTAPSNPATPTTNAIPATYARRNTAHIATHLAAHLAAQSPQRQQPHWSLISNAADTLRLSTAPER